MMRSIQTRFIDTRFKREISTPKNGGGGRRAPLSGAYLEILGAVYADLLRAGARALSESELEQAQVFKRWVGRQLARAVPSEGLICRVYEFAAFYIPGATGRVAVEEMVGGRECERSFRAGLARSRWELCELMSVETRDAGAPAAQLRRVLDDSSVYVDYLVGDISASVGELSMWRVVECEGQLYGLAPLKLPRRGIDGLIYWLAGEREAERALMGVDPQAARAARQRVEALLLTHAIRASGRVEIGEAHALAGGRSRETLVSPSEASLPADVWRRLGQAFSLLEVCAEYRMDFEAPRALEVLEEQQLHLDKTGGALVATLFRSAAEYRRWVAKNERSSPFIRAWRAAPGELCAQDLEFMEALGFRAFEKGAALAARLAEDWRWDDLKLEQFNRLIEALHQAARQLREGRGLAA